MDFKDIPFQQSCFRAININESYPSVVFKENYSKHQVPLPHPLIVNFSINLVSIVAVDEPNQVSLDRLKRSTPELHLYYTVNVKI